MKRDVVFFCLFRFSVPLLLGPLISSSPQSEKPRKSFPEPQPDLKSKLVGAGSISAAIESNYRACTIPCRFPSDNTLKPTPIELSWINVFCNVIPSFKGSDPTVPDAEAKDEKFARRYAQILEDLRKDPESHGGPPDCILIAWI